jgi:hypothetical protein
VTCRGCLLLGDSEISRTSDLEKEIFSCLLGPSKARGSYSKLLGVITSFITTWRDQSLVIS